MDPLIIFGAAFGALLTWVVCKYHYDTQKRAPMNPLTPGKEAQANSIPVAQFDISQRYDIYCTLGLEQRLYEGVRIMGVRTFDKITDFSGVFGGLLELEAANGARMMIPQHGIQMICPTGSQPIFRVLRAFPPPEAGGAKPV